MSANPCVVQADIAFTWDGVPWRLQRGQVIDVPPGSALEQAIGASMLAPLNGPARAAEAAPQDAAAPAPEPEAAPEEAAAQYEGASETAPEADVPKVKAPAKAKAGDVTASAGLAGSGGKDGGT